MARSVDAQGMRDIVYGSTFLGTGGGGPFRSGLALVDALEKAGRAKATLVDTTEMADSELAAFAAAIGAPTKVLGKEDWSEVTAAFRTMQKVLATQGREVPYLIPVELGSLSSLLPMFVGAQEGLPVVDADGAGRAVPELGTLLYGVHGIPFDPLVIAGMNDGAMDSVVINLGDPRNGPAAENIARHVAMAYGMLAGIASSPVNRKNIEDCLAPGSLSMAQDIGRAMREAGNVDELAKSLSALTGASLVMQGKIDKIETKTEGGFDFGRTVVKGLSGAANDVVTIDFKNENMLIRDGAGKVIGTVPDLICLVDTDAMTPVSNTDTAVGQSLAVFAQRAHTNWYRTPAGVDVWRPLFKLLGHDGGYVKFA